MILNPYQHEFAGNSIILKVEGHCSTDGYLGWAAKVAKTHSFSPHSGRDQDFALAASKQMTYLFEYQMFLGN